MTDDLGTEARALLDAAREGLSPDAAAVRRVRARISVATGGATAGTVLGAKLGVFVLVGAIAAAVGFYATRDLGKAATPAREPVIVSPSPQGIAAPAPAPQTPTTTQTTPADDELITLEAPVAPPALPARPARPAERTGAIGKRVPAGPRTASVPAELARPPGGSARSGAPGGIDLAREVELVDLAMVALRRGDARAALASVRRHAVETGGRGQLAEDAAAIEIEALCRLADPAIRARLEAFDARFPRSAQRSRLTSTCP
jgi:type IV secretory pathway VirB10-like protein